MREIKFRAWDKHEKKMKNPFNFGDLRGYEGEGGVWVMTDDADITNNGKLCDIEIMQYTGLKDKNAVEIYEGDILKARGMYDITLGGFKPHHIVVEMGMQEFEDGAYSGQCWGWNVPIRPGQRENTKCDVEVIGNIYENPELLESDPIRSSSLT